MLERGPDRQIPKRMRWVYLWGLFLLPNLPDSWFFLLWGGQGGEMQKCKEGCTNGSLSRCTWSRKKEMPIVPIPTVNQIIALEDSLLPTDSRVFDNYSEREDLNVPTSAHCHLSHSTNKENRALFTWQGIGFSFCQCNLDSLSFWKQGQCHSPPLSFCDCQRHGYHKIIPGN